MDVMLSTGRTLVARGKSEYLKQDLCQCFSDCVVHKPVLALKVFDTFLIYGFHEVVLASFSQDTFPGLPVYEVLYRLYPYNTFLAREGKQSVADLLATFQLEAVKNPGSTSIENVIPSPHDQSAQVSVNSNGQLTHFQVRCFLHCIVYLVTSNNIDIKFCVNIILVGILGCTLLGWEVHWFLCFKVATNKCFLDLCTE